MDNFQTNPITATGGSTFASDDIAGVQYPRMKLTLGADGVADGDVSSTMPMPVSGTVNVSSGSVTLAASTASIGSLAASTAVVGHVVVDSGAAGSTTVDANLTSAGSSKVVGLVGQSGAPWSVSPSSVWSVASSTVIDASLSSVGSTKVVGLVGQSGAPWSVSPSSVWSVASSTTVDANLSSAGSTKIIGTVSNATSTGQIGSVALVSGTTGIMGAFQLATGTTGTLGAVGLLAGSSANMLGAVALATGTTGIVGSMVLATGSSGTVGAVVLAAGTSASVVGSVALVAGSSANVIGQVFLGLGTSATYNFMQSIPFSSGNAARTTVNTTIDISLIAANASRKALIIANLSTSQTVAIGMTTAAVTTALGNVSVFLGAASQLTWGLGQMPLFLGPFRGINITSTTVAGGVAVTEYT